MEEYRASFKERQAKAFSKFKELKAEKRLDEVKVKSIVTMWPSVDMTQTAGRTDNEIELALEVYYVGAQLYIAPVRVAIMQHRYCDANYTKVISRPTISRLP